MASTTPFSYFIKIKSTALLYLVVRMIRNAYPVKVRVSNLIYKSKYCPVALPKPCPAVFYWHPHSMLLPYLHNCHPMEYKTNGLLSDLVTNRFHENHSFQVHKSNNPIRNYLPIVFCRIQRHIHQSSKIPVKVVVDSYMEVLKIRFKYMSDIHLFFLLSEVGNNNSFFPGKQRRCLGAIAAIR